MWDRQYSPWRREEGWRDGQNEPWNAAASPILMYLLSSGLAPKISSRRSARDKNSSLICQQSHSARDSGFYRSISNVRNTTHADRFGVAHC